MFLLLLLALFIARRSHVLAANTVFYDTTWAGAAQVQQNASTPFNFVEATLVVPHLELPKHPHEAVDQYSASFWIGLDGYKSPPHSGLWQAGIVMRIWTNGTREYVGFWEWVPDPEVFLYGNFTIREGDHIHVTLTASTDGESASTTLDNLNTTQCISHSQPAPTSWRGPDWVVPGASAEFIFESGTYQNYTQEVLPDWGTATFLNAKACRQDGSCVLPGDAGGLQVFENFWADTETLYSRSRVESNCVSVTYVEEKCETCKDECLAAGTCFNSTTARRGSQTAR